jgi:hypothetical protein
LPQLFELIVRVGPENEQTAEEPVLEEVVMGRKAIEGQEPVLGPRPLGEVVAMRRKEIE